MSATKHRDKEFCDNCAAGFLCTRLKSAMNILKARIDEEPSSRKELYRYYKTLLELERKGWKYPYNCERCDFKDPVREVKKHTEQLIKVIR